MTRDKIDSDLSRHQYAGTYGAVWSLKANFLCFFRHWILLSNESVYALLKKKRGYWNLKGAQSPCNRQTLMDNWIWKDDGLIFYIRRNERKMLTNFISRKTRKIVPNDKSCSLPTAEGPNLFYWYFSELFLHCRPALVGRSAWSFGWVANKDAGWTWTSNLFELTNLTWNFELTNSTWAK